MPYTARELITRAYYLSGVVSRDFQIVDDAQITSGLNLLNEALADTSIDSDLVPYYKEHSFNAITGQEKYFIPGLIQAETFTFNKDVVRYPTRVENRTKYFGASRQDNIQSLPYQYHFERVLNGSDLYIYFLPNENYPCKIWGKFKLDEVTDECDDLSLIYDKFYIKYLTYATAEEICDENQITMSPEARRELQRMEKKILAVSPTDLTLKKRDRFGRGGIINYGYANLGTGWEPG